MPVPLLEGFQVTYSNAGMGIKYAFGNLAESQITTQGEVNPPPTANHLSPIPYNVGCAMRLPLLVHDQLSRCVATFSVLSTFP
jgi:hypothetical protein